MTRILFIDDDELMLQLMAKVADLLGYQALVSTSPSQGLALASKEKPTLILVDMQMNEMDGAEFTRQVRSQPLTANLPVFIFSSGYEIDDEAQALKAGANGYLPKPVGLRTLSQTVEAFAQPG